VDADLILVQPNQVILLLIVMLVQVVDVQVAEADLEVDDQAVAVAVEAVVELERCLHLTLHNSSTKTQLNSKKKSTCPSTNSQNLASTQTLPIP
jgi:hypothetical protein